MYLLYNTMYPLRIRLQSRYVEIQYILYPLYLDQIQWIRSVSALGPDTVDTYRPCRTRTHRRLRGLRWGGRTLSSAVVCPQSMHLAPDTCQAAIGCRRSLIRGACRLWRQNRVCCVGSGLLCSAGHCDLGCISCCDTFGFTLSPDHLIRAAISAKSLT